MPLAHLFAELRRAGFFPHTHVITDHQFLSEKDVRQFSAVWTYSQKESARYSMAVRDRFFFIPYPTVTGIVQAVSVVAGDYVFAGGNHRRDFSSLIAAIRDLPLKVAIVTDTSITGQVPENCTLSRHKPLREYLSMMGEARFVVVPLLQSDAPHGHGDITAALFMGKAVVTTRDATVGDYVIDGFNGLLVNPGDVAGYRSAISKLWSDDLLRERLESGARKKSHEFTYGYFAEKLLELCDRVASERA